MQAFRCVIPFLLVLALAAAAVAGDAQGTLMAEVEAIGDAIQEAMVANDFDAILAMYADDAISLPNYGPRLQGVDDFERHHEETADSRMNVLSFSSQPQDVWACGDQVIEIGSFEISLEMPGMPAPIQDKGKYLTVYVRGSDGSLKIKVETWNTDMNPMEIAAGEHKHGEH